MGNTLDNNLVSRQAVEKMIKAEMPERGMWEIEGDTVKETVCEVCVDLIQELYKLQPVTPKEKTGRWIEIKSSKGTTIALRCSCCGNSPKHGISSDFCPNCGCRMINRKE